jgi:hypothetical protein
VLRLGQTVPLLSQLEVSFNLCREISFKNQLPPLLFKCELLRLLQSLIR